jgi:hypothetical protein
MANSTSASAAGLERLASCCLENSGPGRDGLSLPNFGMQRLEREVPAAGQHAGGHRHRRHQEAQRQHQPQHAAARDRSGAATSRRPVASRARGRNAGRWPSSDAQPGEWSSAPGRRSARRRPRRRSSGRGRASARPGLRLRALSILRLDAGSCGPGRIGHGERGSRKDRALPWCRRGAGNLEPDKRAKAADVRPTARGGKARRLAWRHAARCRRLEAEAGQQVVDLALVGDHVGAPFGVDHRAVQHADRSTFSRCSAAPPGPAA